jgi:hypothetical protein
MNYQTFNPHHDLEALVKCYWTLEVAAEQDAPKQRIVPDGCIEMAFILGDDIKRYTSDESFILQPRAMVLGQIINPFYIQPVGYVNTFAVRFYPYGFSNFVATPLKDLSDKETSIDNLFGEKASRELEQKIIEARDTNERIKIIETFLRSSLKSKATIDKIIKTTIDTLTLTRGNNPIGNILKNDLSKRRQLERKFAKQIGISPKQLGKIIRMQAALQMLLSNNAESLSHIAYESEYYDQAHFIRDFKEFTGTTPSEFLDDKNMALSTLIYKKG